MDTLFNFKNSNSKLCEVCVFIYYFFNSFCKQNCLLPKSNVLMWYFLKAEAVDKVLRPVTDVQNSGNGRTLWNQIYWEYSQMIFWKTFGWIYWKNENMVQFRPWPLYLNLNYTGNDRFLPSLKVWSQPSFLPFLACFR